MSSPIEAIGGSFHNFSTKPGQNPLKISDNVTAPLLLGLLLRLFKDSLFSTTIPKTYPRQIADIVTEPNIIDKPICLTKPHKSYTHTVGLQETFTYQFLI